jgi:hypothetical protein
MTVLERIESIRTRNQINIKAINKHLYKIVYSKQLLTIAYNKLYFGPKSRKLNKNKENQSDHCLFFIKKIKDIKNKLIKKEILIILEAIYESTFSLYNNSFQKKYCCHKVLKEIKTQWTNITWLIEGNTKPNYESLDCKILIKILRKKIQDERFIKLIWKLTRIQIKINGINYISRKGISRTSILSSLLLKIYINEFDILLEELRIKSIKNSTKKVQYNPEVFKIQIYQCEKLANKGRTKLSKFHQKKFVTSFYLEPGLNCRKIKFVRYESNWKFAIKGPRLLCKKLKKIIKIFSNAVFKLTSPSQKIKIRYFSRGNIKCLGYHLKTKTIAFPKIITKTSKHSIGIKINLHIPTNNIIRNLYEKNFSTTSGKGITKKNWIIHSDKIIVIKYNNLLRTLQNYYSLGINYRSSINRIKHILNFSCAHTLATKHRSNISIQLKRIHWLKLDLKFDENQNTKNFKLDTQTLDTNIQYYDDGNKLISNNTCFICNRDEKFETQYVKTVQSKTIHLQNINILLDRINRKNFHICSTCHLNTTKRKSNK